MLKLLTLIAGFIATAVSFFIAILSRKAIIVLAVITAFMALVVAFLACMKIIIGGIVALIVMPAWLATAIGFFVPSNYAGVLSLIMSAKTCKAAYNLAKEKIALIGQSN